MTDRRFDWRYGCGVGVKNVHAHSVRCLILSDLGVVFSRVKPDDLSAVRAGLWWW